MIRTDSYYGDVHALLNHGKKPPFVEHTETGIVLDGEELDAARILLDKELVEVPRSDQAMFAYNSLVLACSTSNETTAINDGASKLLSSALEPKRSWLGKCPPAPQVPGHAVKLVQNFQTMDKPLAGGKLDWVAGHIGLAVARSMSDDPTRSTQGKETLAIHYRNLAQSCEERGLRLDNLVPTPHSEVQSVAVVIVRSTTK